jgi:hypothetical protein
MLWIFAALACGSKDSPENESNVGSGDDTATNGDDSGTGIDDSGIDDSGTGETCGNGIDDNFNGTSDGCDWSGDLLIDGTSLFSRDPHSKMGAALAVCDANGDGIGDVVTGAPGYGDRTGAVYVFYGPIDADREAKDADYALTGTAKQLRAGVSVDCRRDIDGDGIADFIVGEPGWISGPAVPGNVYVVPGGGTGTLAIADAASSAWFGAGARSQLGFMVIAIDADGDETDEIAATPALTDAGPNRFGVAWLFEYEGPGATDADAAVAYVYGEEGDRIESTIGNAGDLDGDGVEELAITGTDEKSAELLVFDGPLVSAVAKSDADVRIVGGAFGAVQWSGIGHADLDADGRDDLLVGNKSNDGAVYAFLSPIANATTTAAAELRVVGYAVGSDVTSPGDVDGDGTPDLLIGASANGAVFLQYGGGPGVYELANAQAWWQEMIVEDWVWSLGWALAAADVTGDGVVDLLMGSPRHGSKIAPVGSVTILPAFDL